MKTEDISQLIFKLKDKGLTVAFAESCTAGSLAAAISEATGTTDVFLGSMVTYSAHAKNKVLGVKNESLKLYSAESQQVTNEMVLGLHKLLHADVCVAVTGLYGAGGSENPEKPVGTVFVSIFFKEKVEEYRVIFKGDARKMREQTIDFIFSKLEETAERHFQHA
ncbi:CinA family protein [Rufibacter quisquiliarum]|uniref:Nicotinamide-nucleotide amidase n=1 Tax=Rufibacter quisquiliarum TaxID=1549639 RepID=A0A839GPN0_9BACT|nr:CinA family protein [Rufibacter quisquiliarum]MBA9076846.1 nicotinamide-nucleotide amidase [Rufibacter quisquiliarum]